jgi:hypothetical protein
VVAAEMLDAIRSRAGNDTRGAADCDNLAADPDAVLSATQQLWRGNRSSRTMGIVFSVACALISAAVLGPHVVVEAAGPSLAAASAVAAGRRWRISAAWSISSAS